MVGPVFTNLKEISIKPLIGRCECPESPHNWITLNFVCFFRYAEAIPDRTDISFLTVGSVGLVGA